MLIGVRVWGVTARRPPQCRGVMSAVRPRPRQDSRKLSVRQGADPKKSDEGTLHVSHPNQAKPGVVRCRPAVLVGHVTPTRWLKRQLAATGELEAGRGWMARPRAAVTALWALVLLGPGTRGQGKEWVLLVALFIMSLAI